MSRCIWSAIDDDPVSGMRKKPVAVKIDRGRNCEVEVEREREREHKKQQREKNNHCGKEPIATVADMKQVIISNYIFSLRECLLERRSNVCTTPEM